MQAIPYPHLDETLYTDILSNGLQVYIFPKKGYQKTYAAFTTKFGSIDHHFQVEGQPEMRVPDGIAHFLEHKMFEEPDGGDIFATFAAQGASANAFTSFDRTTYLFSATEHIEKNVETLLNFVQTPYFTDANVEKEKGIIDQEINMYQDHPDWRCYFGLIQAMYHVHPVRIDIAGTNESIQKITKELLYDCYHAFYHPSNMMFVVAGNVDPEAMLNQVRENQANKSFPPQGNIQRFFQPEPKEVKSKHNICHLTVSMPKCYFGFKEIPRGLQGKSLLEYECQIKCVLDILFSPSSPLYQTLYDEHLITDSFGFEFNSDREYGFSVIGGDTPDPDQMMARIQEEVNKMLQKGISETAFERARKKKIGQFLRMFNRPEAIANEFTKYQCKEMNIFDMLSIYEKMTLEQVNDAFRTHFHWDQMAISMVKSGEA